MKHPHRSRVHPYPSLNIIKANEMMVACQRSFIAWKLYELNEEARHSLGALTNNVVKNCPLSRMSKIVSKDLLCYPSTLCQRATCETSRFVCSTF